MWLAVATPTCQSTLACRKSSMLPLLGDPGVGGLQPAQVLGGAVLGGQPRAGRLDRLARLVHRHQADLPAADEQLQRAGDGLAHRGGGRTRRRRARP